MSRVVRESWVENRMYDLLMLLQQSHRTIAIDMQQWFATVPHDSAWTVVSDYCIADRNKENDTFAFALVLNHDTTDNISEYIHDASPRDLKSSRTVSPGLIAYLNSPVCFSVTYLIDRSSKLLREYITDDNLLSFIPDARELIATWAQNAPTNATYFRETDRRLKQLLIEMQRPKVHSKLARQVHLVAALAAAFFKCLDSTMRPSHIRWISNRDSMFDRHGGIAFDMAYFYFMLLRSQDNSTQIVDRPDFYFSLPGMDGVHEYDEMIRLPDCLAGTLADIDIPTMQFSHDKFPPAIGQLFVNSPNNSMVQVLYHGGRLTSRRIAFQHPS
jgi:hypothetical protein